MEGEDQKKKAEPKKPDVYRSMLNYEIGRLFVIFFGVSVALIFVLRMKRKLFGKFFDEADLDSDGIVNREELRNAISNPNTYERFTENEQKNLELYLKKLEEEAGF